jgi:hypothetical protein
MLYLKWVNFTHFLQLKRIKLIFVVILQQKNSYNTAFFWVQSNLLNISTTDLINKITLYLT